MRAAGGVYSSNSQISCPLFDLGQNRHPAVRHSCPEIKKELPTPADSLLVAAAVLSVFVIFEGALMWADVHSGPARDQPLSGDSKRRSF